MSSIILSEDAISDLPDDVLESLPLPAQLTEEEFVKWASRFEHVRAEWVDGEVILMSPISVRHFKVYFWLCQILDRYVRVRGLGTILGDGVAIRLQTRERNSRLYPDLMFVAQARLHLIQENHLEGPPDLAIEVVSPDSKKRDWVEKRGEYADAGVREYWIIDPLENRFEAFQLSSQGAFVSFHNQPTGLFTSLVVTGFQFQVEWLWAEDLPYPEDVLLRLRIPA